MDRNAGGLVTADRSRAERRADDMPSPIQGLPPGRYRIRRELGQGGVGVVYEAYDSMRERRVALKTLEGNPVRGVISLKNEFRLLRDLRHPNLVRVYDLVLNPGAVWLVLEYIDGGSLAQKVRKQQATASVVRSTQSPEHPAAQEPTRPVRATEIPIGVAPSPTEPVLPLRDRIGDGSRLLPDSMPCTAATWCTWISSQETF